MISGKISAGEAYAHVSRESEKLEAGLRDVNVKLEREASRISSINRQLEVEFKVDGAEDFTDELKEAKKGVEKKVLRNTDVSMDDDRGGRDLGNGRRVLGAFEIGLSLWQDADGDQSRSPSRGREV